MATLQASRKSTKNVSAAWPYRKDWPMQLEWLKPRLHQQCRWIVAPMTHNLYIGVWWYIGGHWKFLTNLINLCYAYCCGKFTPPLRYRQHPSYGDCLELRENIIRIALCWIVRYNFHSQQYTYTSISYRSNRLGLSHWDHYAVRRGGCLELYYL